MIAKIYVSAKEREDDLLSPIVQRIHEVFEDPKVRELKFIMTGVGAFNNDSALSIYHILTEEKPSHVTLSTWGYGTMAVPELAILAAGNTRWVRAGAHIRLNVKWPSKYFSGSPTDEEREKGEGYQQCPGFLDQERLLDIVNDWLEVKNFANRLFSGKDLERWGFITGRGLDRELELLSKMP